MTKIVASIYKYLCLKDVSTPYFRTIALFSGLVMFMLLLLKPFLPIFSLLHNFNIHEKGILNYIIVGLFFGLIYLVFAFIFKKERLERYTFSEKELKRNGIKVIILFAVILVLIIASTLLHLRNK